MSGSSQHHRPCASAHSDAVLGKDEQTEKIPLDFSFILIRISTFSHTVQQTGFKNTKLGVVAHFYTSIPQEAETGRLSAVTSGEPGLYNEASLGHVQDVSK